MTYVFQLGAAYGAPGMISASTSVASFSQVAVLMNAPPVGGIVSSTPANGTALSTTFFLQTYQWSDSPSDFPLSYVLSYYSVSSSSQIVVKNADQTSYISTVLGQGLLSSDYILTCVAFASDTYGSSANSTAPVRVVPPASTAALASIASAAISSALTSSNPGAVSQLIGAVTSSLNSVNCSVPQPCDLMNRTICSTTALTCGSCLAGYIGMDGDSNSACGLAKDLKKVGDQCDTDSSCVTGLCSSRVCSEAQKQCPNSCSGNGLCAYVDANNQPSQICAATNSFCQATCQCSAGFFGADCSLTTRDFIVAQTTRQLLCVGLYKTLKIQDVSADVVTSRATSIAAILMDISQINTDALGNCTAALVETVSSSPGMAGAAPTAALVAQALSNVLAKGSALPPALLVNVSAAITSLTSGVQSNMAIGQTPSEMNTKNARISASLVDGSGLASQEFSPPQSDVEMFQSSPKPSLNFNASGMGGGIGVAVVQFTNNPHATVTASTSVGFQLTVGDDGAGSGSGSGSGSRRLLSGAAVGATIVLQNSNPVHYRKSESVNGTVECKKSLAAVAIPYHVTVSCGGNATISVTCNGTQAGVAPYQCPQVQSKPQCSMWDGHSFSPSPYCRVVAYTHHNTTCLCSSDGHRRLAAGTNSSKPSSSGPSGLQEIASQTTFIAKGFTHTFTSLGSLSLNTIKHSATILATTITIFVLTFAGLIYLARVDIQEKRIAHSVEIPTVVHHRFDKVMDEITPSEFTDVPWYMSLWNRMMTEHPWMSFLAPYSEDCDYRSVKWVMGMGFVVNSLFVDTVLAVLTFPDDGQCEGYISSEQCLSMMSLDQINTLCMWDSNKLPACSFNPNVGNSVIASLILTTVITFFAIPLDLMVGLAVLEVRNYCTSQLVAKDDDRLKEMESIELLSDLTAHETRRSTIMRAARLVKMQKSMDRVPIEQEAKIVIMTLMAQQQQHTPSSGIAALTESFLLHNHLLDPSISAHGICMKIRRAREHADKIKMGMLNLPSDEEREKYLLRRFLVSFLSPSRQKLANQFLQGSSKVSEHAHRVSVYTYCCLVLLPAYFLMTILYIFAFGVGLGDGSAKAWLLGEVTSIVQTLFFSKPLMIWIKWIVLSKSCKEDIRLLQEVLAKSASAILMRTRGMMKDANSIIQHTNAACRAARSFPQLSVSRLLMSCNDHDFSTTHPKSRMRKLEDEFFQLLTMLFFIALSEFPELAQEILITVLGTMGISLSFLAFAFLAQASNVLVPIVLALVVVGGFAVFEYVRARLRRRDTGSDDPLTVTISVGSRAKPLPKGSSRWGDRSQNYVQPALEDVQKPGDTVRSQASSKPALSGKYAKTARHRLQSTGRPRNRVSDSGNAVADFERLASDANHGFAANDVDSDLIAFDLFDAFSESQDQEYADEYRFTLGFHDDCAVHSFESLGPTHGHGHGHGHVDSYSDMNIDESVWEMIDKLIADADRGQYGASGVTGVATQFTYSPTSIVGGVMRTSPPRSEDTVHRAFSSSSASPTPLEELHSYNQIGAIPSTKSSTSCVAHQGLNFNGDQMPVWDHTRWDDCFDAGSIGAEEAFEEVENDPAIPIDYWSSDVMKMIDALIEGPTHQQQPLSQGRANSSCFWKESSCGDSASKMVQSESGRITEHQGLVDAELSDDLPVDSCGSRVVHIFGPTLTQRRRWAMKKRRQERYGVTADTDSVNDSAEPSIEATVGHTENEEEEDLGLVPHRIVSNSLRRRARRNKKNTWTINETL